MLLRWTILLLYSGVLAVSLYFHELWGDELHSWNLAGNSANWLEMFRNARYEGHPPLWYVLIRIVRLFSQDPESLKILQFFICITIALIVLFRSSLPLVFSLLILFGYYFSFEYTVLCRNYSPGILLAIVLVTESGSFLKSSALVYCILLFLLSITHVLGLFLAIAIHISLQRHISFSGPRWLFVLMGICLLFPAALFISPPGDSSLGWDFWNRIWTEKQYTVASQVMIRSFLSVPDWTLFNFWNSNYILNGIGESENLRLKCWIISGFLLIICLLILKKSKTAVVFFILNVFLTLLFAFFFPLSNARYVGFVFVGFILGLVIHFQEARPGKISIVLASLIMSLQIPGTVVALGADWKFPFSQYNELKTLVTKYQEKPILTDYWSLNYLTACTNQPYYCIGYKEKRSYILWNAEMKGILNRKKLYTENADHFFSVTKQSSFILVSIQNPDQIWVRDSLFFYRNKVNLLEKYEGAIEKYSNIYIYDVSDKP